MGQPVAGLTPPKKTKPTHSDLISDHLQRFDFMMRSQDNPVAFPPDNEPVTPVKKLKPSIADAEPSPGLTGFSGVCVYYVFLKLSAILTLVSAQSWLPKPWGLAMFGFIGNPSSAEYASLHTK